MNKIGSQNSFTHTDRFLIGAYVVAAFLTYYLLHGIYRPENMDDAWFLSFAYNHVVNGVESDVSFGVAPGSGGFGGVMLFGKTFSYLYGQSLNLIGWTRSHSHMISTTFMVLSAVCWWAIVSKLGFGKKLPLFFMLALLLVEPFFGAANQARPDALSFLVVSAALLCFLYSRYGFSGFLTAVALEIHPVGVCALFFMASVVIAGVFSTAGDKIHLSRMALWFSVGMGLGCLYYLALHGSHLALLPSAVLQGNTGGGKINNFLFQYFLMTKYLRHIPELVGVVACTGFFWLKRYHRENAFIPIFLAASMLFTLTIRRPNFMYTIYVYPAFLLLFFWVFERRGRLRVAASLVLLYLLPQYGLVYLQNRDWNLEEYLDQVRRAVPKDSTPIVGRPNDWFAFIGRPFFSVDYLGDFDRLDLREFILIEGEDYRKGAYPKARAFADRFDRHTELYRFHCRGEIVIIRRLVAYEPVPAEQ